MNRWEGRSVAVLGLARSGLAVARVLSGLGARVLLSDQRPAEELGDWLAQASQLPVEVETGGHSERVLQSQEIVISPGVSIHHPLLQQALALGIRVSGEVEVAWELCPAPLIAITGTNGKSTTASLIQRMLGQRSVLAGNIGTPLVSEMAAVTADQLVVAEISSFQLETVHGFRPVTAVLTNITPDHLDRHRTMEEYIAAKARLFWQQGPEDRAVFNADDPAAVTLAARLAEGRLPAWLSGFEAPEHPPRPQILRYSAHTDADMCHRDGWFWHRGNRLLRWHFPGLPGPHNLSNGLAAALVAAEHGVSAEGIEAALAGYGSLHHRLEQVGVVKGVRFVDDSKATNVASVRAALETFQEPIALIAGGRDKGLDLDELGAAIAEHCQHLVAIGEAAETIAGYARAHGLADVEYAFSMERAVETAFRAAQPGWVVLLSPACTSFDMFKNAEDRGDQFAAAVKKLEEE